MNIMIPTSRPDQRTPILAAMLRAAAISAPPTKYTQNIRPGMYFGTRSLTNSGPKRWSAPKTASGTAKHRLLKATILSRPWAWAISFFAAHIPIKKTAMPAEHIATAVPEVAKNTARMAGCMGLLISYRASEFYYAGSRTGWAPPSVIVRRIGFDDAVPIMKLMWQSPLTGAERIMATSSSSPPMRWIL